jgi:hypothetical protein
MYQWNPRTWSAGTGNRVPSLGFEIAGLRSLLKNSKSGSFFDRATLQAA